MRQEDLPKANATCVICGNRYYRCEKCIKLGAQGIYPWKLFCDTSKCYMLYSTLEAYSNGLIGKKEARAEIESNGGKEILSKDSKYVKVFNEILVVQKKIVPEKPIVQKVAEVIKEEAAIQATSKEEENQA